MIQIDRRHFIASLGGAAAVKLLSSEAKAEALESYMDVLGDVRRLTQYNTAQSIPIAAANEGGAAGLGAGLGAGLSIGQTMASNMADAMRGGSSTVQGPADVTALLEKLHELLTKGVLTQEEFDTKKAELLKKIT